MADPYQIPTSDLRENLPPRSYAHALIAAISSFVTILAFGYALVEQLGAPFDLGTSIVEAVPASIVTGILFLIIRNLRWHVAIGTGAAVGVALFIVTILLHPIFYG